MREKDASNRSEKKREYKKSSSSRPRKKTDFKKKSTGRTEKNDDFKKDPSERPERRTSFKKDSGERPARKTGFKKDSTERPERRTSFKKDSDERPARRSSYKKDSDERPERKSYLKKDSDERPARRSSYKKDSDERPERKSYIKKDSDERPARRSSYKKDSDERPERKSYIKKDSDERPARKSSFKKDDSRPGYGKKKFGTSDYETKKTYTKRVGRGPAKGPKSEDENVRLNKYIANRGICSRREADDLIASGVVTVNGVRVTELGTKVGPKDVVRVSEVELKEEKKVYILLNKPKDYVTTVEDPHADRTVMQLIRNACKERVYPVGRLDRNTTGVLLFTNDGELTKRLTHPKYNKKKIYHVWLDKNVTKAQLQSIVDGIELEDGFVQADAISFADATDKKQVGIELHSGKNRIIRRIFESLGFKVVKLDRVYFAGLTKKNLPRGKWRFLTEKEIQILRMGSFD